MNQSDASEIDAAIKELVEQIAPDVRFVAKYGGEVMCPDPDSDKKFVGGIFSYKEHVSLEFSEGASFDDPDGVLEGSGKKRRHLKLVTASDVEAKGAKAFIEQALHA